MSWFSPENEASPHGWIRKSEYASREMDLKGRRETLRNLELESYAAIGREVVAELLSTPPVRLVSREKVVVDLATLAERHGASDE